MKSGSSHQSVDELLGSTTANAGEFFQMSIS